MTPRTDKFTDTRGRLFHIDAKEDGTFALWTWRNKNSGWRYIGGFATYQEAHDMMVASGMFDKEAA
jgi:hypothetical protein